MNTTTTAVRAVNLEIGDRINGRRVSCLVTGAEGLVRVWVDGREARHQRADLLYSLREIVEVDA